MNVKTWPLLTNCGGRIALTGGGLSQCEEVCTQLLVGGVHAAVQVGQNVLLEVREERRGVHPLRLVVVPVHRPPPGRRPRVKQLVVVIIATHLTAILSSEKL